MRQKLSGLEEILGSYEPVLDANGNDYKGYLAKIKDVFEAGYYLTVGKTPQQNSQEVLVQVEGQSVVIQGIKVAAPKGVWAITLPFYDSKTNTYRIILSMNGDLGAGQFLRTLVHESGHGTSFILNPKIVGGSPESSALQEAQAYAFEAAWNRTVYGFLGKGQSKYQKSDEAIKYIDDTVNSFELAAKKPTLDNYHSAGDALIWLEARKKGMLKLGQPLSAQQSYELFLDLVNTPKDDTDARKFANDLLSQINPDLSFIKEHAYSRLDPNYEQTLYAHSRLVLLLP